MIFPQLFDTYENKIQNDRLLMAEGKIQKTEVVHVIVRRCFDYTKLLGNLAAIQNNLQPVLTLSRADENQSL